MNKKQLHTLVHATACGACGASVSDLGPDESDDFWGLANEMGLEAFARFIQSLRFQLTDNENQWHVFSVCNLEEFDTVPAAVEHLWNYRHILSPWKTDD